MTTKMEIVLAIAVVIAAALAIYAYQTPELSSWKFFDTGLLIFCIVAYIMSDKYKIVQFSVMCFGLLVFNSWITSVFYDVTVFGLNQKIYGWLLSTGIFFYWIAYHIGAKLLYKKLHKQNEECKREARGKYEKLLRGMDEMKTRINENNNFIDDLARRITE